MRERALPEFQDNKLHNQTINYQGTLRDMK